jgi:hypothetical protein
LLHRLVRLAEPFRVAAGIVVFVFKAKGKRQKAKGKKGGIGGIGRTRKA